MPYTCTICEEGKPAAFLLTPLSGGDTIAIGDECAAVALTGILAGYLGMDADQLYQLISEVATAQAGPESREEAENYPQEYYPADQAKGLCGLIHPNKTHCHRKALHTGRHTYNKHPDTGEEGNQ